MNKKLLAVVLAIFSSSLLAQESRDQFKPIVETHRAMILLVNQSDSPDPLAEGIFAARNAYAIKREYIELLTEQAEQEAATTTSLQLTRTTQELVNFLATDASIHDADWLAFSDLIDELTAIEQARALSSREMNALKTLAENHKSILDYYRKAYGKVLKKLAARGERRETWEEYLAFLHKTYQYETLLNEFTRENSRLFRYMNRGENNAKLEKDVISAAAPQIVWGNNLPEKTVVLTFDDGPHARNTDAILDILKQYEVNAYFFSVGKNLGKIDHGKIMPGKNKPIAQRIIGEGHLLGNHSYSHAVLTKLDPQHRSEELGSTNLLINNVTGIANSLFRPPYGSKDKSLDTQTRELGMVSVMWNIDSMDWADPIPESIADRTLRELEKYKKGILLFHDIHKQTVNALPDILDALAKGGYRVVTLDGRPFNENVSGLPKLPDAVKTELYSGSRAVVIGINNYQYWPKLEYAVNDANAIADTLHKKLGFPSENIITLIDGEATSERITEVLGYTLANPEKVKEDDRVFVFFAGHGTTRTMPNGKSLGYIIPVDTEIEAFQNRAISMSQLGEFTSFIPAKHIYFVMDSCYSGLALTRSGINTGQSLNYLQQITGRKTRQILTAGGADQEVADGGPGGHSIFTWTLLQGLDGLADTDNNGYITASELGTYVAPVVSSYSEQTPSFGNLLGSEGGDFVFSIAKDAVANVSKKLADDEQRILDELNSLRQNTTDSVKRRLELELELEKQKRANAKIPTTLPSSGNNPPEGERLKQAKRMNAAAVEYIKEKKFKEAKEELAESVRLNPYNPTIVNNYGYVLDQLNENKEALEWYYRTVELDPQRTSVYFNLGDIMVETGRYQEAVAYYERYLHLYPSYKDAKIMREKIEQYRHMEQRQ